jgi:hypothetical protein
MEQGQSRSGLRRRFGHDDIHASAAAARRRWHRDSRPLRLLVSWTEFLGALTFTTNDWIYTLPVALVNIESSDAYGQINYGVLIAGAVIAMITRIIMYVAFQRFYVRSPVSGAVKG